MRSTPLRPARSVVVYPNNPSANPRQNPRGAYYENLIITKRVKLQGVGPGSPDGSVRGSIIDGGAFAGDSPVATDWYTRIGARRGPGTRPSTTARTSRSSCRAAGATPSRRRTAPARRRRSTASTCAAAISRASPATSTPSAAGRPALPGGLITQGGAIFANGYARNLQITNNVIQSNGGAYGTIRIGTPDLPAPDTNNHNEGVRIANNRIIQNAGTNQAGGIGLFNWFGRLRGGQERHLRQLLVRVRRRCERRGLQPERLDPRQPHLLQRILR